MKNLLLAFVFLNLASLEAGYTLHKGQLVNIAEIPSFSADQHYFLGVEAMNQQDWKESSYHFNIIVKNFPNHDMYSESQYFLGVSYYFLNEYDFANTTLSEYLLCHNNPCYFEDAIGYKLKIANCFRHGAKRRFFGSKSLPKWASARTLAEEIYNEVIGVLPCHDYAAQALYAKAHLNWEDRNFRESVQSFQTLIRRFPKHELTPVAYLLINRVYLDQVECEFQNPDLLVLAQINTRKFEKDFPKEERIQEALADVQAIKELYAKGLFETGQFYERKECPEASIIYYKNAIKEFPDTLYAACSRCRLELIHEETSEEEYCDPSS